MLRAYKRNIKSIKRRKNKKKRYRLNRREIAIKYYTVGARKLIVPDCFSLKFNTKPSIVFINQVKSVSDVKKRYFIKFSQCNALHLDALSLLTSTIKILRRKGFRIFGDTPKGKVAKRIFEESGFYKHLGNPEYQNAFSPNTIIEEGTEKVDPIVAQNVVRSCMKFLVGKEERNRKLYPLLIEMMANTVNHAFDKSAQSRWLISKTSIKGELSKEDDKVILSFIDNGIGIFKTLNKKWFDVIRYTSFFGTQNELIKSALEGNVGSRTKLPYRGRGLPKIYNTFSNNNISNLFILTNNVILDFESGSFRDIDIEFEGTMYLFEISKKNL